MTVVSDEEVLDKEGDMSEILFLSRFMKHTCYLDKKALISVIMERSIPVFDLISKGFIVII